MGELYISMYHYIRDFKNSRYPQIKGLDISLFKEQLEFMKRNFNIVTMEQVMDAVQGKSELPEKALLLTFDDGYTDHFMNVMPLLEDFGVQGSFFIPGKPFTTHMLLDVNKIHYILATANITTLFEDVNKEMDYYRGSEFDFPSTEQLFEQYAIANRFDTKETIYVKRMLQTALPERLRNIISSKLFEKYVGISEQQLACELYMSESQIRTMKRHGMFIGFHGYDHYWLGNLSAEQLVKDVDMALDTMSEFIDRKSWVANYPYGNYSQGVIECLKKKGAIMGLTVEARVAYIGTDNPFEIPRFDCNDFPPKGKKYLES